MRAPVSRHCPDERIPSCNTDWNFGNRWRTSGLARFPLLKEVTRQPRPSRCRGPYPYETPAQVPAPTPSSDSSTLPSPTPLPYRESSALPAAQDHDSRTANARGPLTAKAVRDAAFKYNGVANFCGFLAALPANVSVFNPKLGTTCVLVRGSHVVRKNVAWLRNREQTAAHEQSGSW